MPEITLQKEDVAVWQPQGCISCPKPPEFQETAFLDGKRLPISVAHCGDNACVAYAQAEALRIAAYPEVQEMAM